MSLVVHGPHFSVATDHDGLGESVVKGSTLGVWQRHEKSKEQDR
jgi:hypothetical protein